MPVHHDVVHEEEAENDKTGTHYGDYRASIGVRDSKGDEKMPPS